MQHSTRAPRRRDLSRPASFVWRSPERHLWVATGDGEYAGMARYDRRVGFTAIGPTASTLGRFPSLEEAQAAIEAADRAHG